MKYQDHSNFSLKKKLKKYIDLLTQINSSKIAGFTFAEKTTRVPKNWEETTAEEVNKEFVKIWREKSEVKKQTNLVKIHTEPA